MVLLFLLSLVVAAPPAPQASSAGTRDWYQAYQDGVRAVGQQQWTSAIQSLKLAKSIRSQPGRQVNTNADNFIDYLPDYYLAIAYAGARQYSDARAALVSVESSKMSLTTTEYDRLTKAWPDVSAVADFRQSGNSYVASVRSLPAAGRGSPAQTAETTLARGVGPVTGSSQASVAPAPPTNVTAQNGVAQGPSQNGTAAASRGNAAVPDVVAASTDAPDTRGKGDAGRSSAPIAPTPNPPSAVIARGSSPGSIPRVPRSELTPSPKDVAKNRLPGLLPSASRADLEPKVVALFLQGDYARAGQTIESIPASQRTARLDFYAACSRVALILSGQASREGLQEAQTAVARLDLSALQRDRRYISPSILSELKVRP